MKSLVKKLVVLETHTTLWYECVQSGYSAHNSVYFCVDFLYLWTHRLTSPQIDSIYFNIKELELESIYSIHLINWDRITL